MSLSMSAAPVSMHVIDRHSVAAAAAVIQSHIAAMYLPSLFTGFLLARLGLKRLMLGGCALLAAACSVAALGHGLAVYWTALVLLGLGWNFLFIGGTTLLARTYAPEERFGAQALNDFAVFAVQAAVSLLAGSLLFLTGWPTLNLLSLPAAAVMAAAVLSLRKAPELQPVTVPDTRR
jgi:MFS family permease